ncbi:MAG: hypothetical protein OJI67_19865 [Prosthecobacter sp.]|nr:hypothetical protein [Prosthecobacter sp.]
MKAKKDVYDLTSLIKSGNAPAKVKATVLNLSEIKDAGHLPLEIECHTLIWKDSPLIELPACIRVSHKLDLSGSTLLEHLPKGLRVSVLTLTGCTRLTALPEDLHVDFLTLDGCTSLRDWPDSAQVRIGAVSARGCTSLERLPTTLGPLTTLNLRDCVKIDQVPPGVQARAWIDIGGTRIDSLPESLHKISLRWRGVRVTPQIAFFPETLKSTDVLAEANSEVRRVMIERIGFERFLQESNASVLHEDTDPGGPRQLLRVELQNDEPLVCVSVRCPSTSRHYLIRVPPQMETCHQAVAWTAGFDNPDDYVPIVET